jgi:hypothetical protein
LIKGAEMTNNRKGISRLQTIGLATGGVLVGAALLGATAANAASSTTPSTTSSTSASSSTTTTPPAFDKGGATPVRSDEKSVSTAETATLTAAALKAVPGATVFRVETDAGDAAFEVHLTKADGTLATVKFDKSLAVVTLETGMGQGDPAPTGTGPTGTPPSGTAPAASSSATA